MPGALPPPPRILFPWFLPGAGGGRRALLFLICVSAWLLPAPGSPASLGLDELLRNLYPPPATVERAVRYLSREEQRLLKEQAGVEIPSRMLIHYRIAVTAGVTHYAYLDGHKVRTKPELLLIIIGNRGELLRLEVLEFSEPPEYAPPREWLRTQEQKPLTSPEYSKLPPLTGATLTTRAGSEALRRIKAIHLYLYGNRSSP